MRRGVALFLYHRNDRLLLERFRSSVLQHGVIHLVHVLRHLWSSALQGELKERERERERKAVYF